MSADQPTKPEASLEESLRRVLSVQAADGAACDARALYRFASGEASREESAAFERHLSTCEACRADLETFRNLPADAPEPKRGERPSWLQKLLGGWTLVPLAAAAAAALLVLIVWRPGPERPELTLKSGYRLHVAVQRGEKRFTATSGSVFELGDTLGLFYTAPDDAYLTVLVADGAGSVTVAYPTGAARARVSKGVEQRLEVGAVVEKGTACEWIVGVFGDKPLAADAAREALKKAVAARGPDCTLPALGLPAAVDVFVLRRTLP